MNTSILLLILALIGVTSYVLGSRRAVAIAGGRPSSLHSRAGYHGAYALILALIPSALILAVWLLVSASYYGVFVWLPVQLAGQVGPNWLVKSGLKPGERVITDGWQKVMQPGMPVTVKGDPAPAGAPGAAGASAGAQQPAKK